MNNKSSQKTAKAASGKAKKAAGSKSGSKSDMAIVTVPECDSASETAQFCDQLLSTLAQKPKALTLRFIGPHSLPPDSALILHEIITNKHNGVTIITEAWSPVLGASFLVWLAGDVRHMRRTTFAHFRSLQENFPVRDDKGSIDEFMEFLGPNEPAPFRNLCEEDYKTVLQLLDEYIPVEDWCGKIIRPPMLQELGLLGAHPVDDLLKKFLSGTDAPASPEEGSTPKR
jgi:hypothetical protein